MRAPPSGEPNLAAPHKAHHVPERQAGRRQAALVWVGGAQPLARLRQLRNPPATQAPPLSPQPIQNNIPSQEELAKKC
jgi:hypothetical protein